MSTQIDRLINTLNAPKQKFWISDSKRANAARDLGKLAPEAIPGLIKALSGPGKVYAVPALVEIGRSAVPALLQELSGPGAAYAVVALKKIGAPCVEELIREFKGKGAAYAHVALKNVGPSALRPLMGAVKDSDATTRMWAAMTLGDIGAWAAEAIPELEAAQNDPDANVRQAAWEAIQKIKAK